jgi:hypothetical protein
MSLLLGRLGDHFLRFSTLNKSLSNHYHLFDSLDLIYFLIMINVSQFIFARGLIHPVLILF